MNPWPVDAEVDEVHLPRPGHADLAGIQKFGHTDVRNVLERASARETAARVAAGALAKAFLRALGRRGALPRDAHRNGDGAASSGSTLERGLTPSDFDNVDDSPVRSSTPPQPTPWSPRSMRPGRRTSRSAASFA